MSDLISRQAAIDRINKQREHLQLDVYPQDEIGDAAYRICSEFIERLPSAERKKGKWIDVERAPGVYRCSVCSYALEAQEWGIRSNYCPHCGARMVRGGEDESED